MSVGQVEESCFIDSKWKVWEGAVSKETLYFAEGLCIVKAWNEEKCLMRTLAMIKLGKHDSKLKWNYRVWCDAFGAVWLFLSKYRIKVLAAVCVVQVLYCFLGGTDSSGTCVPLEKKKKKEFFGGGA